ncbi:MAG TPA: hypothetical protein DDY16_08175, partial [Tenacibaculum sp.]|nr:hypothetical protein [Tenacibaculum sp.]
GFNPVFNPVFKPVFKKDDNNLIIFYTNADSVFNKKHELLQHISNTKPDIIQITEALPKNYNKNLNLNQYLNIPG